MPQMKYSAVFRGGATSSGLAYETGQCSASVNLRSEALEIRFDLAAAGGGTTCVLLRIGKADFPAMLHEIASEMPEYSRVLSDCASLANGKNLEALRGAHEVLAREKARAGALIDDLEEVGEFVSEKYYEAPSGEDEREQRLNEQLQLALGSLRVLKATPLSAALARSACAVPASA